MKFSTTYSTVGQNGNWVFYAFISEQFAISMLYQNFTFFSLATALSDLKQQGYGLICLQISSWLGLWKLEVSPFLVEIRSGFTQAGINHLLKLSGIQVSLTTTTSSLRKPRTLPEAYWMEKPVPFWMCVWDLEASYLLWVTMRDIKKSKLVNIACLYRPQAKITVYIVACAQIPFASVF